MSDDADRLFLDTLDLSPDERRIELERRCANDPELRAEVEALLAADAEAEGFLEPPERWRNDDGKSWLEGRTVGQYVVRRSIGVGGMSTVYEAQQRSPNRAVALKILRAGIGARELRRRFAQEAEILGRLRHPGIAEIYETGTYDSELGPLPFFALEFIPGARRITTWSDEQHLDVRARVALMIEVCRAVQHAHERGVIHRDLKPSNILVGDDGRARLIDFGVARLLDELGAGVTAGTQIGELVGTLHYMSPEQCSADAGELDARSDVYALGVVLYELVAGRLPYPIERAPAAMIAEIIRSHEPAPPTGGAARWRSLDAVILTALDKRPARRYASAAALADDLDRALRGEPVFATRSRRAVRVRKLAWQLRRALPTAIAVGCTAVAVAYVGARPPMEPPAIAPVEAPPPTVVLPRATYQHRIAVAEKAIVGRDLARAKLALGECPVELRGWEWHRLLALTEGSAQILVVGEPLLRIAHAPSHGLLVALGQRGGLHAFGVADTLDGMPRFVPRWHAQGDPDPSALVVDDRSGIILAGGDHRDVARWSIDGEPLPAIAAGESTIWGLALVHDPDRLAVTRQNGRIELWDPGSGAAIWSIDAGVRLGMVARTDEGLLATSTLGASLRSLDDGRELRAWADPEGPEAVLGLGDAVYTAGWSRRINEYDRNTRELRRQLALVPDGIVDLEAIGDDRLASAGKDGVITLWDRARGSVVASLRGHDFAVESIVVDPAGRMLASASLDGTVRLWDLTTPAVDRSLAGAREKLQALAWVDDEHLVTAVGPQWGHADTDAVILWTATGRILANARDHRATVDAVAVRGTTVVSGSRDGELVLRDRDDLAPRVRVDAHPGGVTGAAFSDDGHVVASVGADGTLARWDAVDGGARGRVALGIGPLRELVWTPRGWIAVGRDGLAVIDDHDIIVRPRATAGMDLLSVALLDADTVVVGASDGTLARVDLAGDALRWAVPTFGRSVAGVAVAPDRSRIAVASEDYRIRLYDADSGELALTVGSHDTRATSVAFSPDGAALASGGFDRRLRLWTAPTYTSPHASRDAAR